MTFVKPLHLSLFAISLFIILGIRVPTTYAAGTNLIQNPSFEIAGTSGNPANWIRGSWGSPTPTFKYPDTGSTGGKAASVTYNSDSTGGVYWGHDQVDVIAGEIYTFGNWYKSNVVSEIDAEFADANGKLSYAFVKSISSSSNTWKQASVAITIPAGVTKMRVYQLITKKGTLVVDAFSLMKVGDTTPPTPAPTLTFVGSPQSITSGENSILTWGSTDATSCTASNGWSGSKNPNGSQSVSPTATTTYMLSCVGDGGSISKDVFVAVKPIEVVPPIEPPSAWDGLVTFSFDDSWISQYTTVLPILQNAGIKGTFYITTQPIQEAWEDFMTPAQVKDIANEGHEIGDHTITHPHLTKLSKANIKKEVINSKTYLESLIGNKITSFAYPYGEFNNIVINILKSAGYDTARGVDYDSLNIKSTNKYKLYSQCIEKSTPFLEIKKAIDDAKSNKQWYIICIHEVKEGGDAYSITPTQFQQIVDYVKSIGIKTVTVKEGKTLMEN